MSRRTPMTPGMGLYLCIGTGLGIGLFRGPGWGWQALAGAIIIAIANVLLKSTHCQGYIASCKRRQTEPSVIWYISLSFLQNLVTIFIVAFVVFLIRFREVIR